MRSHSLYIYIRTEERSGKGNNQNVLEQLDLESSFTCKIYSDYACLKVGRETLRTINRFLEQSRSVQSIYSTYSLQQFFLCCFCLGFSLFLSFFFPRRQSVSFLFFVFCWFCFGFVLLVVVVVGGGVVLLSSVCLKLSTAEEQETGTDVIRSLRHCVDQAGRSSCTRLPKVSASPPSGQGSGPALTVDLFPGRVIPVTTKLVLHWLSCQAKC